MAEAKRRLAAIMFTDFVGYSALSQKNEALALELIEEKRALIDSHLSEFDGQVIKSTGDGFLLEFGSAIQAVNFANRLQNAMAERNGIADADRIFQIRIGIHLGDVVYKGGDVFGDGVNIAARIEPLAQPGGISISQQVYDQVHNKVKIGFRSLGKPALKNIDAPIEVFEIVQPGDVKADPANGSTSSQEKSKQAIPVWIAVPILVLAFAVWLLYGALNAPQETSTDNDSQMAQTSPATQSIRAIAVLPFENLSDDAANEYFSDGMTEEILNSIAQMEGLRVISRTSVFQLKDKDLDIAEIGSELNVDHILEGSVRRSGDQVRINVRLVNIAEDRQIWSESYDRHMEDVFKIQDEIANAVADKLQLQLTGGGGPLAVAVTTQNSEAFEYYLKGRFFWGKRTSEGFHQARVNFQEAIRLDPNFAPAYAGLADTYNLMASYDYMEEGEAYSRAKEAAERSLELNPDQAEATASLAYVKQNYEDERDLDEAKTLYERAIELNPNYATAHQWYSVLLKELDREEQALQEAQKAHQLDPLSPVMMSSLGHHYLLEAEYDLATSYYKKALEIDPLFVNARTGLARIQQELRNFDAVEQQTEELAAERPNDMRANMNWATGKMLNWKWDEAEEIYLNTMGLEEGPLWESNIRWAYSLLLGLTGRTKEALTQLEIAMEIDPENDSLPVTHMLYYGQLLFFKNYKSDLTPMIEEFESIIEDENQPLLNKAAANLFLSYAHALNRDFDDALATLDAAEQIIAAEADEENPFEISLTRTALGQRGVVYALQNDREKAEEILDQLIELEDLTGIPSYIAQINLHLGEIERAYQWLEVGVRNHDIATATIAFDPNYEPFRDDPRYEAFLEEMNLTKFVQHP